MSFKDYSLTPSDNTALGDGTYIGPGMLRNKVRPAFQALASDGRELSDRVETIADTLDGTVESTLRPDLAAGTGASLVGYIKAYTGAVIRSVADLFKTKITPADFGAKGDGDGNGGGTDDYAAWVLFTTALTNSKGLKVDLEGKTYLIAKHHTATNGVNDLTISGAAGLTFDCTGAKLDIQGNFDRDAATTQGIGLIFDSCPGLYIKNPELDGNVDQMTNSSGSVEGAFSYGIQIKGCEGFRVKGGWLHHFPTDGMIITYSGSGPSIASKRGYLINCRFTHNARMGCTFDAFERITCIGCEFTDTGRATGTYGVHAPVAGIDIEPQKDASFVGGLDVDSNNLLFINCKWKNNKGGDVLGVLDRSAHTVTVGELCRIESSADASATSPINVGLPRFKFKGCYIDVAGHRMEMQGGSNGTGTIVVDDIDFHGSAASNHAFYSAVLCPLVVRNSRFICSATSALTSFALIDLAQAKAIFRKNYVFVPAAAYSDGGVGDGTTQAPVVLNNIREASGNTYETDLTAAAGSSGTAHLWNFSYGTTLTYNERFIGTAPGTADTWRPANGSSFDTTNLYSANKNLVINGGTPLTLAMVYSPSITPASVAAQTVAEQTFTVNGLTTADKVTLNPPAIANATGIAGVRVSAANTLAIRFANPTAGALTPTSGIYTVLAFRS